NVPAVAALEWNPADGAENYHVQVSEHPGFTTLAFEQSGITQNTATAAGLATGTQYFWRIRATNSAGNSEWSETWSFTTQAEGLIPGLLDGLEDITKTVDDILGNITSRTANEEPEYGTAEQKESSSVAT